MGPVYDRMEIIGSRVEIVFQHAGSGLAVRGEMLKGFEIGGSDGNYVQAEAAVTSKNVVSVWSNVVQTPAAVRYGWNNSPETNLYNMEGLPASPFRTDEP